MKALNLDRLNSLACIASTVSSIGTDEARKMAGKLLEMIEAEAVGQTVTSVDDRRWSPKEIDAIMAEQRDKTIGNTNQEEPGVTVGESYLKGLEQDRIALRRLATLIDLHDRTVAIAAGAATSALTVEIGELIAKHKA